MEREAVLAAAAQALPPGTEVTFVVEGDVGHGITGTVPVPGLPPVPSYVDLASYHPENTDRNDFPSPESVLQAVVVVQMRDSAWFRLRVGPELVATAERPSRGDARVATAEELIEIRDRLLRRDEQREQRSLDGP